ncbi:hypothetical protein D3C71_1438850 [compost metagenome]
MPPRLPTLLATCDTCALSSSCSCRCQPENFSVSEICTVPIALLCEVLVLLTVSWPLRMVRSPAAWMFTSFSATMLAAVRLISPSLVAMRTPPPTDSWVPVMVSLLPLPSLRELLVPNGRPLVLLAMPQPLPLLWLVLDSVLWATSNTMSLVASSRASPSAAICAPWL